MYICVCVCINNLYDAIINIKHAKHVGWSYMLDVYSKCLFYTYIFHSCSKLHHILRIYCGARGTKTHAYSVYVCKC